MRRSSQIVESEGNSPPQSFFIISFSGIRLLTTCCLLYFGKSQTFSLSLIWDYIAPYKFLQEKIVSFFPTKCYLFVMENKDRVKILRILSGYTQPGLSLAANIPKASLGAIEMGHYNAVGEKGAAIAEALGVTFNYLYQGSPYVDEQRPQVWTPQPAARAQHLQAQKNEISLLFPKFLAENSFSAVIVAELKNGFAFFFGREATDSKHKYAYNCLLLAENRLAESFKTAIKSCVIKGYNDFGDIVSMVDRTIETISVNDIYERLLLKERYCECNIDGLGKKLQAARKRIAEKGTSKSPDLPPAVEYTFRSFIEALVPSIKSSVALGLTKLFLKKCEEHGHKPKAKIADALVNEFRQELDGLGIKEFIEKPTKNILLPKNAEYWLIEEYLREKMSDDLTTQEQREAFLERLTRVTDFKEWKEKYENEVEEGKRPPQWF